MAVYDLTLFLPAIILMYHTIQGSNNIAIYVHWNSTVRLPRFYYDQFFVAEQKPTHFLKLLAETTESKLKALPSELPGRVLPYLGWGRAAGQGMVLGLAFLNRVYNFDLSLS